MSYIGKQPTKAPLTASDIEDGIITAAKIEDGAVVAAEIASNAVTTAKINADAVTAAKIADDVINSEHIVADSIDAEHYAAGSVDTTALGADAVTGAKIADDAINSEHYTDGSVDTAHIADANVTTAKVADDAITLAKMASGTDGNIISYDASGNPVAIATGNDGQVLTSTGAGSPPAFESLASSNPYTAISKAEAGYITLVGGLIIQWAKWGTFGGTVSNGSVSFPITFPSTCYTIVTGVLNGNATALSSLIIDNGGPSTSGFSWYQADSGQSSRMGGYIAIGV